MKKLYDIRYGEQKENLLDIYIPDKNNFKTVVWIHGGGLEEGDKNGIKEAPRSSVRKNSIMNLQTPYPAR